MPRCSKSIGFLSHALCALFLMVYLPSTANAFNNTASESAIVTATVLEQTFNPPTLISPGNNSITNNPRESFSWRRPSPVPSTPLNHYDFYLDGNLFAQNISDSITSTEYYFYNIHRQDDVFYLDVKTNMSDGYHQWKVVAYNDNDLSSESETWTFYIDASNPNIKLTSVDTNTLNWDTNHPESIPPVDQRYLYVTQNPLLTGTVEPYANLQFTLLCPLGVPSCSSLTQTFNYPSGNWQHRFYNLVPNQTYIVYLSATDTAGNHVFFPTFYLIYLSGPAGAIMTPIQPTPTLTISPPEIPPLTIPQPTTIIEPPTLSEIFLPAQFVPVPPAQPTPPPVISTPSVPTKKLNYLPYLLILLIIGLPLHLFMSQFGTNTHIKYTLYFLATLLFPFLSNKKHQTHPFTTIIFYDPRITYRPWQTVISDINGFYSLKENIPGQSFIKCFSFKRNFKPSLIYANQLGQLCLYSQLQDHENNLQRLQNIFFATRSFPLVVAILTSSIALLISPSYFILTYLYLSLQAGFSEYIYPKIEK